MWKLLKQTKNKSHEYYEKFEYLQILQSDVDMLIIQLKIICLKVYVISTMDKKKVICNTRLDTRLRLISRMGLTM